MSVDPIGAPYVLAYGITIMSLLLLATRTFTDIMKGASPFTEKQVNRFRVGALLLVLLTIVDMLLSTSFSYDVNIAAIGFGAHGNYGMEPEKVSVNVLALFFAAILYGISILFRYGVLLQRLTDETE